ncbi:hypothetical protein A6C57_00415 [Fibrella sp. ES10-3-2-2]
MDKQEMKFAYEELRDNPIYRIESGDLLAIAAQLHLDRLREIIKLMNEAHDPTFKREELRASINAYMMLIAMSLENLGKAVHNNVYSHNLKDLIGKSFKLTEKEGQLLVRLEHFLMWAGRYPFPKSEESYYNGISTNSLGLFVGDPDLIESLTKRLKDIANSTNEIAKKPI